MVVPTVATAGSVEREGQRGVDRSDRKDRRGEDPDPHLPPEGSAANVEDSGRRVGIELHVGDLNEREEKAL